MNDDERYEEERERQRHTDHMAVEHVKRMGYRVVRLDERARVPQVEAIEGGMRSFGLSLFSIDDEL